MLLGRLITPIAVAALISAAVTDHGSVASVPADDFHAGKVITFVVGATAGGGL
jgi:hypothetical protein